MATVHNSRKAVKPVRASWRWLRRIGEGDPETGLLDINGTTYGVIPFPGGYRLVKADGTAYDVHGETWACDCPDATYRERQCKHALALRAALAACGM
jgi:hypothetical protein